MCFFFLLLRGGREAGGGEPSRLYVCREQTRVTSVCDTEPSRAKAGRRRRCGPGRAGTQRPPRALRESAGRGPGAGAAPRPPAAAHAPPAPGSACRREGGAVRSRSAPATFLSGPRLGGRSAAGRQHPLGALRLRNLPRPPFVGDGRVSPGRGVGRAVGT